MKATNLQLVDLFNAGVSSFEASVILGIIESNVVRRWRKLGLSPQGNKESQLSGLKRHSESMKGKKVSEIPGLNQMKRGKPRAKADWNEEIIKSTSGKFALVEYLGEKKANIVCIECGAIMTRHIKKGRSYICDCCKFISEQKHKTEVEKMYSTKWKTCPCCFEEFETIYSTQIYCSKKCKTKARNFGNHIERAIHYGVKYDTSVTLPRVIAKDNSICYLCGEKVDKRDRRWGSSGPLYPSIDHVVALKNGGTHTWDNVRLAHIICNSYKRDLSDEKLIMQEVQNAKV